MQNKTIYLVFLVGIVAAAVWAFLPLMSPYSDDEKADIRIVKAELERDHSYYWLTLHLKGQLPEAVGEDYGLLTPENELIRGVEAPGMPLPTRFWIHRDQLIHTLKLKLNDSMLTVKSSHGLPQVENTETKTYRSAQWTD